MPKDKDFSANFEGLNEYLNQTFQPEDEVLSAIRQKAEQEGLPAIHVSPYDGRLLTFFAKLVNAQTIVEIGTLAGYSAICLARGMKPGGKITTFEMSEKHADISRYHFKKFGFDNMIQVVQGNALHNLSNYKTAPLDLIFIDADKNSYVPYFKWSIENLRPGGIILADNTLAWGQIHKKLDPNDPKSESIRGLQAYNTAVAKDPRVFSVMLPTGEGMTASIKIS